MEKNYSIKFSVVVPVYNSFDFLLPIIDWFSKQYALRKDIELIVVDDGSTECCSYNHEFPGIRWFKKNNGGVSAARNYGLRLARGEYVSFLDSDDLYSEDFFSVNDSILTLYGMPDLILNSYSIDYGDDVTDIRYKQGIVDSESVLKQYFLKIIRSHICSLVLRRESMIDRGLLFDESIGYAEDVLFTVKAINSFEKIALSESIVYKYIIRPGSAVNRKVNAAWLRSFIAYDEILSLKIPDNLSLPRKFFISTCYVDFYHRCIRMGVDKGVDTEVVKAGKRYIFPYPRIGYYYFLNIIGCMFVSVDRVFGGLLMRFFMRLREGGVSGRS
ncbi:MAG: glycosyltransferase [Pseudomonadota bacterium]|nr:glycosyltransferase [Pseudomonadota bacterium]